MTYLFRDLLALEPLSADELSFILDQAKPFQEIQRNPLKKLATLRGKTVVLAFFENSTRTRLSFGTAASRLGADTMNLQAEASSLKKGETLLDTANNLNAMKPDCFVMRHSSSGAADFVARHLEIPVVNAGDGTHEHPSQGLLDALTIRDRKGTLRDLNVTILGDIAHSRLCLFSVSLIGRKEKRMRGTLSMAGPKPPTDRVSVHEPHQSARYSERSGRNERTAECTPKNSLFLRRNAKHSRAC